MPLGERGPHEPGSKDIPPIGSSDVKMFAYRHRHAAYHNKHWQQLIRNVNIDNLE